MMSLATQQQVRTALRDNDMARAALVAEAAIAHGESHETLYCLAALSRQEAGDNRGAAALYLHAAELAPGNPGILSAAGDALRCAGQLKEALNQFDRAIEYDPSLVAAWYGRALALESEAAFEEALHCFARVTELAPQSAAGFAGLAGLQARSGDLETARENAQKAQALGPGEGGTLLALARCAYAAGDHEHAVKCIKELLDLPSLPAENEILAAELLGDSHDKLGQTGQAYDAYLRANARFVALYEGPNPMPVARLAIEAIAASLEIEDPARFSGATGPVPFEAENHVFLLGYPRSGTTLTEQILTTLPGMVSLEEAPTLAHAEQYLGTGGLQKLITLNNREVDALRAGYWEIVAAAGVDTTGKTFVDMDPLKGAALPLIARLFPRAKVIVMHRDPRDVIWSCFRHSFVHSPATCEFTSLERAARHYNAVMGVVRHSLTSLPIDFHVLSYEQLVRDFEGATGDLCNFLGIEWSAEMRAFERAARERRVRTASASQVRQPLYDGSGQWQRYGAYIQPVIPLLAPWTVPAALSTPSSPPPADGL